MLGYCDRGHWFLSGHWWSLPSDLLLFPTGLILDRQPTARCPSWPHRKQWLQLAVPLAMHDWHLTLVVDLGDDIVLTVVSCDSSGLLVKGVRAFQ